MLRLAGFLLSLSLFGRAFAGDATCYRSAAEAATGTGVEDSRGYYLVVKRLDPLTRVPWAAVAHCGQPELPIVLVRTGTAAKAPALKAEMKLAGLASSRPPAMRAAEANAAPNVERDAGSGPEPKVLHVRVNRLRMQEAAAPEEIVAAPATPLVVSAPARPLILAGSAVRVLWEAGSARGELTGLAMGNGVLGESVKVRMAGLIAGTAERIVSGTVQQDGTLTLEAGR